MEKIVVSLADQRNGDMNVVVCVPDAEAKKHPATGLTPAGVT